MNKKLVDRWLPYAEEAIRETGIANNQGEVDSSFRGQISSFGAAVYMGSLLTAIAFFSQKAGTQDGNEHVDRTKLLEAILSVLKKAKTADADIASLYTYALGKINHGEENSCREEIIHAAVALKLAMNLFKLK